MDDGATSKDINPGIDVVAARSGPLGGPPKALLAPPVVEEDPIAGVEVAFVLVCELVLVSHLANSGQGSV